MTYIWLGIIILLAFIESATISLTTIWFIISGLVSLLLSFVIDNIVIQVGVFSLLGIFLMLITRPILQRKLKVKQVSTNIDRVVGMKGIVTEKIEPLNAGEVKVDGKKWTAISDITIEKGNVVQIEKINGVKLEVKLWEE